LGSHTHPQPNHFSIALNHQQIRRSCLPAVQSDGHYPSNSSLRKLPVPNFQVAYGDNTRFASSACRGTFRIGPAHIFDQPFGAEEAHTSGPLLPKWTADGMLGLAFPPLRDMPLVYGKNPLQNLFDTMDARTDQRLFTVKTPSRWDRAGTETHLRRKAFITFGEYDMDFLNECKTRLWWAPLVPRPVQGNAYGHWSFLSEYACVGDERIERTRNAAIADTGSAQAFIERSLCEKLYGALGSQAKKGSNGWLVKADTPLSAMPKFGFAVGKRTLWIAAEDFFNPDDHVDEPGFCLGAFQERGPDDTEDLLGAPFLKNTYAVSRS
jgi:hypothetical protein